MLFQVGFLYTGMLSLSSSTDRRRSKSCRAKKRKTVLPLLEPALPPGEPVHARQR